jgi:hypothetical protein
MRQEHRGGEKLFIDYSDGLSIVNKVTGVTGHPKSATWGQFKIRHLE